MIYSSHPVEPHVRQRILAALTDIEHQHHVTVLFACESGSRGWGFASPDSDYDVRFIYVNRLPWYLTALPQRDVIELPISDVLDINGWDLRKALGLLRESNPTLLEWLRSPIVYRQDDAAMGTFATLAQAHFSRVRAWHHYAAMAKKNFREYLQGDAVRYKKYLYVLRPLLAARWIAAHDAGAPPMRFAELAEQVLDAGRDAALIDEINRLLEVKMRAGEAATSARWTGLHEFITRELAHHADHPLQAPAPRADVRELDAYLLDTVQRFNQERA
ncbi:nucleotidyltransferase domain-containing protein [Ottowia testudinis]|uniref:Nucleotidyltransferase domain-containing protein n=1 Tax=Ottowia testudinis TaxID=2816950 RepID=A0A975H3I6_9BURK|nr:nucleotidyltransferase domain-containing protein [Ottowia testudinis]QTD45315.1 nucleotidyltransferase domain-containing protein [Ottowia testudinis]